MPGAEPSPALIALDWGSSSCRAWLLDAGGAPLDERRTDAGTLAVSGRGDPTDPAERALHFERAFLALVGDWVERFPGVPALASGMVGSDQGWTNAAYIDVPTSLEALAGGLARVTFRGGMLRVVPGLYSRGAEDSAPDVIRGEETQVLGVLSGMKARAQRLVLPGTHTKWVSCENGAVTAFTTAMSGELFALTMRDSIVGRLATRSGGAASAFDRGVRLALDPVVSRGLAADVFTGRTLVISGELPPADIRDYVSGVFLGHEVRALADPPGRYLLCGSGPLVDRYARALELHGCTSESVDESATVAGLWRIAELAGLVAAR